MSWNVDGLRRLAEKLSISQEQLMAELRTLATQSKAPKEIFCIELHHYPTGQREVFITTPDGTGVMFPAEYLAQLVDALPLMYLRTLRPPNSPTNYYLSVFEQGPPQLDASSPELYQDALS